ncbi:MAG TPA: OmpA family protein [Tepidisphaeraceae bacterium]|jgi:outer membrane protein OmpA-like peptidoglycan-associated protein|nr:OmpA family protein [Tepidisphaeraceae bacterium]
MAKGGCKCKKSEECEECPEWIFTFADLVMLMMGFFVILWVLKPTATPQKPNQAEEQNEQYLNVLAGIRSAFGYIPNAKSQDPVDQFMLHPPLHLPPKEGMKDGAQTKAQKAPTGPDQEVTTVRSGPQAIVQGGRLMFDAGSTDLTDAAKSQLDQIAQYIAGHYNIMMIKGHASLDDFPAGVSPQKQMQLSIDRAQAVANYLTSHGVDPGMLRIQGCSTFEPVAERAYTTTQEAQNRRVEVEETDTLIEQRQDPSAPVRPGPADLGTHAN